MTAYIIHPSIHCLLLIQGPDLPFPGHSIQLFLWDPKVFPDQPSNIVTPAPTASHVGDPESYDGDLRRCRGFLLQCLSMFAQRVHLFPTDRTRTNCIIGLLLGRLATSSLSCPSWVKDLAHQQTFAGKWWISLQSILMPDLLWGSASLPVPLLVDSGADDLFINDSLARQARLPLVELPKPRTLLDLNGGARPRH